MHEDWPLTARSVRSGRVLIMLTVSSCRALATARVVAVLVLL